jgi:hypothetical protein
MSNGIYEFSKATSVPVEEAVKYFENFKTRGIIYTAAKSADEFFSNPNKFPLRAVYFAPVDPNNRSLVSFGPFPIEKDKYFNMRNTFNEEFDVPVEAFAVYLGFLRLSYEKTGTIKPKYSVGVRNEDVLDSFLSLMEFWDIYNPIITDEYAWILPTSDAKKFVEGIANETFEQDDYSWWDFKIDLKDDLYPETSEDYPEDYTLIPTELQEAWSSYLPTGVFFVLLELYHIALKGGTRRNFKSLSEVLVIIEKSFQKLSSKPSYEIDRELLLKELCDYNQIPYPVDAATTFDYLRATGLLITKKSKKKVKYILPINLPDPHDVFQFPPQWEKRIDNYLNTGSVLFSYLTLEEIVSA